MAHCSKRIAAHGFTVAPAPGFAAIYTFEYHRPSIGRAPRRAGSSVWQKDWLGRPITTNTETLRQEIVKMSQNMASTCVCCGAKPICALMDCKTCAYAGHTFVRCQVRVNDGVCDNVVCGDFGCRTRCHDCYAFVCTPCFQSCGASCAICDHDLCDECAAQCERCGDCFCCAHTTAITDAGVCGNCTMN